MEQTIKELVVRKNSIVRSIKELSAWFENLTTTECWSDMREVARDAQQVLVERRLARYREELYAIEDEIRIVKSGQK